MKLKSREQYLRAALALVAAGGMSVGAAACGGDSESAGNGEEVGKSRCGPWPDAGATPETSSSGCGHQQWDGGNSSDGGLDTGSGGGGTSDAGGGGSDASAPEDSGAPSDASGGDVGANNATPDVGTPVEVVDQAGGETCATAVTLGEGRFRVSTEMAANDQSDLAGVCGVYNEVLGPEVFFRVSVPAGHLAWARLEEGSFDGSRLAMVSGCTEIARSCERLSSPANPSVSWANVGNAPTDIYLMLDGSRPDKLGEAVIAVEIAPLDELTEGSGCSNAVALAGAAEVQGSTAGRANVHDGYTGVADVCERPGGFAGAGAGPDATYAIEVPAGKRLVARVTESGGWDGVVAIFDSCPNAAQSCLAWNDGVPTQATVTNTSGQARQYFVVVDGFHSYSAGDFSLSVTVETP